MITDIAKRRFDKATKIMEEFISDLNISFGSVVICSGNHDVLRFTSIDENDIICEKNHDGSWEYAHPNKLNDCFKPFEDFLDNLHVANSQKKCGKHKPVSFCTIDNLNVLVINTNWGNPKKHKEGYFCIHCDDLKHEIEDINEKILPHNGLNIVLAHKPIYEICEKARLSYKRYIKTPFMSELHRFIGNNGIYLCGDKHTRSIVGTSIHDIAHYIGGEPLKINQDADYESEVEYNLLEISDNKLGMERKIHLKFTKSKAWECDIRPQDAVVSRLYDICKKYITDRTFDIISGSKASLSWEGLCQEIYNKNPSDMRQWYDNLNDLYQSICKYRNNGIDETKISDTNIFDFVYESINKKIKTSNSKNVLNIRGEHNSGKSTFLGLLYIYLLYKYSIGKIDFIPAYFNMESDTIFKKISHNGSYRNAVNQVFLNFTQQIQEFADKEHQSICYIIDGIDEQDCWSYSTENSVGRTILDILSEYDNSWYIISYSQHRLPRFKNTMPIRKYNDTSDIMYFNPIDVKEKDAEDKRFVSFVEAFCKLIKLQCIRNKHKSEYKNIIDLSDLTTDLVEDVCDIIRRFRQLTITPGFMYENVEYLLEKGDNTNVLKHKNDSVTNVYNYYIDRQYEICLQNLGYGFVYHAPVMAYLFTLKGYTYEQFKQLKSSVSQRDRHDIKPICDNFDKVYKTFLFIKKYSDAREYLIALHYNQEFRYYAENQLVKIEEDSILNEFITRNISVFIRKLWSDTNKFVIALNKLLERDENERPLNNCAISTSLYCLAHLPMYTPIRDELREKIKEKTNRLLEFNKEEIFNDEIWITHGKNDAAKLINFIDLSVKHSLIISELVISENPSEIIKVFLDKREFHKYNRQFQMLYYGDLSIRGETQKRPLQPGKDIVSKGFDFHNSFNYLFVKLSSNESYPLREYDMFTLFDLVRSRLMKEHLDGCDKNDEDSKTFFYHEKFFNKATKVLEQTVQIFEAYLSNNTNKSNYPVYKYFSKIHKQFNKVLNERKKRNSCSTINDLIMAIDDKTTKKRK